MEKMKTSNKILTIFLSAIAFYFLVFALDLRLLGVHRNDRIGLQNKTHKIPLEDFKYLKLENTVIEIVKSDSNYIQITYANDSITHYGLKNSGFQKYKPRYNEDTICFNIFRKKSTDHTYVQGFSGFKLFTNKPINYINAQNSQLRISKFKSDSMNLVLNNSCLHGLNDSSFGTLNVSAHNNSRINGPNGSTRREENDYSIETLNITLELSSAYFEKSINQLSADLIDNSNLNLVHVDDIRIKKEICSKVYFR